MKSVDNSRVIHQSLALFELQHQQQTSEDYLPKPRAIRTAISTDHQTARFIQNKQNVYKTKYLFSYQSKSYTDTMTTLAIISYDIMRTSFFTMLTVVAGIGRVSTSICLCVRVFFFAQYLKINAARITKLDIYMLHSESWNPFILKSKGQR